jgi:hypothetical protein
LIQQNAVEVDQSPIRDGDAELAVGKYVIRVGKKRFLKVAAK